MIAYRHGLSKEYNNTRFPGRQKFANITMKRGTFKGDNELFELWNSQTKLFQSIERRTLTISLLDEEHSPVVIWTAKNAWPTKVQSTDLKSDGNEVAVETIEWVHEGLTVEHAA